MIENILSPSNMLDKKLTDKCRLITKYKDALNSHVAIKQELLHKSNQEKLNPGKIQEDLNLKKLPTEKQTQAHIDEKYAKLTDDYALSKENINIIKKELELVDDEIRFYELLIKMGLKE